MKTTWKKQSEIKRDWYLIDVAGKTLGRAASEIAKLLIGKSKVDYVPNLDCGDHVIVTNASKIAVTGRKKSQKKYYRHSGYAGGFKEETFEELMNRYPEKVILLAVKNMLPKNKLRDSRMSRLRVFADENHGHEAQKPEKLELE